MSSGSHIQNEMLALIEVARAAGWRIETGDSRHFQIYPPNRTTPRVKAYIGTRDWRGPKNLRSQLRRAGLEI